MRLLLDTHIWLWRLLAPERLARSTTRAIADTDVEICLSPISVWETLVLARKGRLDLRPSPREWVQAAIRASRPTMVPLTHAMALESETLEGYRSRDPADRFLVATARIEGLTLATADRAMLDWDGVDTV